MPTCGPKVAKGDVPPVVTIVVVVPPVPVKIPRVPLLKIALTEGFVHHGAVGELRAQQRIDAPGILGQVRDALGVMRGERPAVSSATRSRSRTTAA